MRASAILVVSEGLQCQETPHCKTRTLVKPRELSLLAVMLRPQTDFRTNNIRHHAGCQLHACIDIFQMCMKSDTHGAWFLHMPRDRHRIVTNTPECAMQRLSGIFYNLQHTQQSKLSCPAQRIKTMSCACFGPHYT